MKPLVLALGLVTAAVVACSGDSPPPTCAASASSLAQPLETDGACTGDAVPCASVAVSDCTSQAGCFVDLGNVANPADDQCRGAASPCSGESQRASCERLQGCRWNEASPAQGVPVAPTATVSPCGPGSVDGGTAATSSR